MISWGHSKHIRECAEKRNGKLIVEKVLIGVVIFVAALLQGVFGFAFMMIAVPLLCFFYSMKIVVPLLSLFLILTSGIILYQLRGKFDYRGTMPLVIGSALGIPPGIYFLIGLDDKVLKTALGVFLIAYSVYSLFFRKTSFRLPSWTAYLFGFFAGLMGGAFNITGPPAVIYLSARDGSKFDMIGSLNLFFCFTSFLVLAYHLAFGNITKEITLTFLELIPAMIAGMLVGVSILKRLSDENYRRGLFVLLIIMGIMLML